jgi:mono/diheme cytochrome c family protein
MKKWILFAALAAFVIACGNSSEEKTPASSTASAEKKEAPKAIDGSKIYKQYCVTCHGLYGDMGASGAFDLTTSALTVEERVAVISNGRNTMTPFKDLLSPEKIQAVAEYTLTLKKEE